jgi:hypothetical protein
VSTQAHERGDISGERNMSDDKKIMCALQYPTAEERNVTVQTNQPRQPHNLQDLLRFSIEANTTGHNASNGNNSQYVPGPMDEEVIVFHLSNNVINDVSSRQVPRVWIAITSVNK